MKDVDLVIDVIGGEALDRSFEVLKSGGILVSSVAMSHQDKAAQHRVRVVFFLVSVRAKGLTWIVHLLDLAASFQPSRTSGALRPVLRFKHKILLAPFQGPELSSPDKYLYHSARW